MTIKGQNIIRESAALRGQKEFQKAIDLVQNNFDELDDTIKLNGWLECFYAARDMNDKQAACRFAAEIAKEHPELPSIQSYL